MMLPGFTPRHATRSGLRAAVLALSVALAPAMAVAQAPVSAPLAASDPGVETPRGALPVPSPKPSSTSAASVASVDSLTWDDIPWMGIEQALAAGKLSTRKIFIYVHAPWCPYCRRMNTEILNDPEVQEAIGAYFSPVRINTESAETVRYFEYEMSEREFAGALRNESLPTIYFMSAEGEVFAHQPGLLPREALLKLVHFVGSDAYKEISFDAYTPPASR